MGTNELKVKKKRFKRFFQGLYLQKIMSGIFFLPIQYFSPCKGKKGQIKCCNFYKNQQLLQKRSSEVLNSKKNKESVGDLEEGEDEKDDGNNSYKNKVVDESATQRDHINVFEKNLYDHVEMSL